MGSRSRSMEMDITSRRGVIGAGLGLLLASPLAAPEAGATRIQYYATVGERLCDLNFVKSGLGYCDVEVGSGVKPPPGELINVSSGGLLTLPRPSLSLPKIVL